MPIDQKLLTLTQWLSPSYPIGAFAFSHGIEQAITQGWIEDAEGLHDWLHGCVTHGSGHTDAVWLRLAYDAEDAVEVDACARAFAPSWERRREADRQGAAFTRTTNAVYGFDLPDLLLPVAVGRSSALAGLDQDTTVLLYLQAFVGNLVSASLRLMPIGQVAGQRVVADLNPVCIATMANTRNATVDDVHSCAFLSDIASMRHETLEPRLFQS
ncbi:MAG: urease accessory protein UreF [Pseudomonadota bacterium]